MIQKLYVASSWRNALQPSIVLRLRRESYYVYDFRNPSYEDKGFSWSEIDPAWQSWGPEQYRKALNHPAAERGFTKDFNAMEWADACVLVLPCGRSAHLEAGWFWGTGKPVFVLLDADSEPELMVRDLVLCLDEEELIDALRLES